MPIASAFPAAQRAACQATPGNCRCTYRAPGVDFSPFLNSSSEEERKLPFTSQGEYFNEVIFQIVATFLEEPGAVAAPSCDHVLITWGGKTWCPVCVLGHVCLLQCWGRAWCSERVEPGSGLTGGVHFSPARFLHLLRCSADLSFSLLTALSTALWDTTV